MRASVLAQFPKDTGVPTETTLRLLLVVLQSRKDLAWVPSDQTFPLMLTLCSIIDKHRRLDPSSAEQGAALKTLATDCLELLEKSVTQPEEPSTGRSMMWLRLLTTVIPLVFRNKRNNFFCQRSTDTNFVICSSGKKLKWLFNSIQHLHWSTGLKLVRLCSTVHCVVSASVQRFLVN